MVMVRRVSGLGRSKGGGCMVRSGEKKGLRFDGNVLGECVEEKCGGLIKGGGVKTVG